MRQVRRLLLSLVAVLLCLHWSAALPSCLRPYTGTAAAQLVELCSPSGFHRTILVDRDGKEVPKTTVHPGCPMCQHAGIALPSAPPCAMAPPTVFVAVAHDIALPGLPPIPPRGPPQQPRAPPIA
ncbi:hypothetical protein MVG78_21185 (plasmid) [Roseomonas gilardii subsp. gilardii]|uniref:hypothetical protein n=1 Tax=Roseomonas gilardii TaxID=257708 RepID=UPI001FFB9999|nr:hypothetical protein [Roseomonas gilardii]UPG74605.1 hypothetical protein MVG78_21185 [Roseomonas gilardii subsp. gilardii]